jgi:1,4-dihydroxy-2-naphthoate octaprenyltransferase
MKRTIGVFAVLSVISGLSALWLTFGSGALSLFVLFVLLGAAAMAAAITYTAGWKPYGYAGLGDLAVLIFFGWVGVIGSFYLQAQRFDWPLLLPATSSGLLTVAVLNVNNIRDIESDRSAGKLSLPVRLGPHRARLYHWGLLIIAFLCASVFVLLEFRGYGQFLFLVLLPLIWRNGISVYRTPASQLDPMLRQTSLLTLLFVLTFGVGQLI